MIGRFRKGRPPGLDPVITPDSARFSVTRSGEPPRGVGAPPAEGIYQSSKRPAGLFGIDSEALLARTRSGQDRRPEGVPYFGMSEVAVGADEHPLILADDAARFEVEDSPGLEPVGLRGPL